MCVSVMNTRKKRVCREESFTDSVGCLWAQVYHQLSEVDARDHSWGASVLVHKVQCRRGEVQRRAGAWSLFPSRGLLFFHWNSIGVSGKMNKIEFPIGSSSSLSNLRPLGWRAVITKLKFRCPRWERQCKKTVRQTWFPSLLSFWDNLDKIASVLCKSG